MADSTSKNALNDKTTPSTGGSNTGVNQICRMVSKTDEPLFDEFVALWVREKGGKQLEKSFRDSLNREQDERATALQKSGDFNQYAFRSLETMFRTNEISMGRGQGDKNGSLQDSLNDGNQPEHYEDSFVTLQKVIDRSLDQAKEEQQAILFPVFVCLFLNMIMKKFNRQATVFFKKHKDQFLPQHQSILTQIENVEGPENLEHPDVAKFIKNKFVVKMSISSFQLLRFQINFYQLILILHIINQNIDFQLSNERNVVDQQCQESILVYENVDDQNKTALNLGRLKEFYPEAQEQFALAQQQAALVAAGQGQTTQMGQNQPNQQKSAIGQTQIETQPSNNPDAPRKIPKKILMNELQESIPLPKLSKEMQDRINLEFSKQVKLGDKTLPSIGSIDLLNTSRQVNCCTLSDSGDLMVLGLSNSQIKVFILNASETMQEQMAKNVTADSLKVLYAQKIIQDNKSKENQTTGGAAGGGGGKSSTSKRDIKQNVVQMSKTGKLQLNLTANKTEQQLLKDQSQFTLVGHSGPVFSVSVSVDDKYLLSASFDSTVRRWSLQTRSILVVYHGHSLPIWNVQFSPLGYYFSTCSNDRTANVWNMKHHSPVRIFSGHLTDIECIEWHPNCHYVATGSSDKQVRLWSVETGQCDRMMFTVAGTVRSLKFTRSGLYLLAANDHGKITVLDINKAIPIDVIQTCQIKAIWSMDISYDDTILAIGTEVGTIELYSITKLINLQGKQTSLQQMYRNQAMTQQNDRTGNNILQRSTSHAFLKCYHTKANGVQVVKFTWRNFLTTIGCIEKNYF